MNRDTLSLPSPWVAHVLTVRDEIYISEYETGGQDTISCSEKDSTLLVLLARIDSYLHSDLELPLFPQFDMICDLVSSYTA